MEKEKLEQELKQYPGMMMGHLKKLLVKFKTENSIYEFWT